MAHLASWPLVALAGLLVGVGMGLFGVGGSSLATLLLALLGAPGLIAVASPLPATIPAAALGAAPYVRSGEARPRAAAWSIAGGLPGTILGALLSRVVGGQALLIASGVVLAIIGVRVLRPLDPAARQAGFLHRLPAPWRLTAAVAVRSTRASRGLAIMSPGHASES